MKKEDLKGLKLFIYGPSFIGKTQFANTFPKPFFFNTDGNLPRVNRPDSVVIKDIVEVKNSDGTTRKIKGWEYFKRVLPVIIADEEHETIVLDVMTDLWELCREYVLSKNGASYETDIKQQGKIWALYDSELKPILRELATCNKNVIIITHEKERDGYIVPTTISTLTQKIQSFVEINARMKTVKNSNNIPTRMFYAQSVAGAEGGNRLNIAEAIENATYDKLIDKIIESNQTEGEK